MTKLDQFAKINCILKLKFKTAQNSNPQFHVLQTIFVYFGASIKDVLTKLQKINSISFVLDSASLVHRNTPLFSNNFKWKKKSLYFCIWRIPSCSPCPQRTTPCLRTSFMNNFFEKANAQLWSMIKLQNHLDTSTTKRYFTKSNWFFNIDKWSLHYFRDLFIINFVCWTWFVAFELFYDCLILF